MYVYIYIVILIKGYSPKKAEVQALETQLPVGSCANLWSPDFTVMEIGDVKS